MLYLVDSLKMFIKIQLFFYPTKKEIDFQID